MEDFKGKNIVVTGSKGFIGGAIKNKLDELGAHVMPFDGEIRDKKALENVIWRDTDYVFHFAGPSSQILFKRSPEYCTDVTVNGFLNVSSICKEHNIRFIYPSTGLLSMGEVNEYARCKLTLESIHRDGRLNAIGVRIFAGYGPGEGHKREYASVPYLFVKNAIEDILIDVYGDGSQMRDFIYIDDAVDAILKLAWYADEDIIDVGSGSPIAFNQILVEIEHLLKKEVRTRGMEEPTNYVMRTKADTKLLEKYKCLPTHSMKYGIGKIIEERTKV